MFWAELVLPGKWEHRRETEERDKDSKVTIFAAYLSPATGSLKVFTLTMSFSNSVPAVGCLVLDQEFGYKFVAVL